MDGHRHFITLIIDVHQSVDVNFIDAKQILNTLEFVLLDIEKDRIIGT